MRLQQEFTGYRTKEVFTRLLNKVIIFCCKILLVLSRCIPKNKKIIAYFTAGILDVLKTYAFAKAGLMFSDDGVKVFISLLLFSKGVETTYVYLINVVALLQLL